MRKTYVFSKFFIIITILLLTSCSSSNSTGFTKGKCFTDPEWYSDEDCPRGSICGFANIDLDSKHDAEVYAKTAARSDLAQAMETYIDGKLTRLYQNEKNVGIAMSSKTKLENGLKSRIEKFVRNTPVHEKDNRFCDDMHLYWIGVELDPDAVNWNELFKEIIVDLDDQDRDFLQSFENWKNQE